MAIPRESQKSALERGESLEELGIVRGEVPPLPKGVELSRHKLPKNFEKAFTRLFGGNPKAIFERAASERTKG